MLIITLCNHFKQSFLNCWTQAHLLQKNNGIWLLSISVHRRLWQNLISSRHLIRPQRQTVWSEGVRLCPPGNHMIHNMMIVSPLHSMIMIVSPLHSMIMIVSPLLSIKCLCCYVITVLKFMYMCLRLVLNHSVWSDCRFILIIIMIKK